MNINTDINILGGLPDWNLVLVFLQDRIQNADDTHSSYTAIKTDQAVRRFERAIRRTMVSFKTKEVEVLVKSVLIGEQISADSLLILFWHASVNNELLGYLNQKTYFPAFYSGRISLKADEGVACLKELRESEPEIKEWADYTIEKVSSKYLTLLKKFNLMEGSQNKTFAYPYLSDKMLVLFVYWLLAVEPRPNLLESQWLKYCFTEKQIFLERVMQKKFAMFFNLYYSGDNLKIEPIVPYEKIYDATTQS